MSNTFLEDIPEFLEIQRTSFLRILDNGLIKALEKINPIEPTPNCNYGVLFYPKDYVLVLPDYTITESFLQGKTYGCKIYVPITIYENSLNISTLKGRSSIDVLHETGKNLKTSKRIGLKNIKSSVNGGFKSIKDKNKTHFFTTPPVLHTGNPFQISKKNIPVKESVFTGLGAKSFFQARARTRLKSKFYNVFYTSLVKKPRQNFYFKNIKFKNNSKVNIYLEPSKNIKLLLLKRKFTNNLSLTRKIVTIFSDRKTLIHKEPGTYSQSLLEHMTTFKLNLEFLLKKAILTYKKTQTKPLVSLINKKQPYQQKTKKIKGTLQGAQKCLKKTLTRVLSTLETENLYYTPKQRKILSISNIFTRDCEILKKYSNYNTENFKTKDYSTNQWPTLPKQRVSKKEWVCVGVLPLMTPRGHFIINGSHRIIVSQMSRAPGLYYQNGEKIEATIVPSRGAWLRISTKVNENGEIKMWARITPQRKMPYKIFFETYKYLEVLKTKNNFKQKNIIKLPRSTAQRVSISKLQNLQWVKFLSLIYKNINNKIKHFDKHYAIGVISGQINRTLLNSSSFNLGSLGRKRLNERLGTNEKTGYITNKDIYLIKTNLLRLLHQGSNECDDDIDHLTNRRVRTCGELLQTEIEVGFTRLKKSIEKQIDTILNQNTTINLKTSTLDPNEVKGLSVRQNKKARAFEKYPGTIIGLQKKTALLKQYQYPMFSFSNWYDNFAYNQQKLSNRVPLTLYASPVIASSNVITSTITAPHSIGKYVPNTILGATPLKYNENVTVNTTVSKKLGYVITQNKPRVLFSPPLTPLRGIFWGRRVGVDLAYIHWSDPMFTLGSGQYKQQKYWPLWSTKANNRKEVSNTNRQISNQMSFNTDRQGALDYSLQALNTSKVAVLNFNPNGVISRTCIANSKNNLNVRRAALEFGTRVTQKEKTQLAPFSASKVVGTKAFAGALREFFGSNPLSQYMDQTNPLAEITHKRRLSSLGPGGVDRASAGIAIRGIHPSHYGRICPIETPEGKNAGLVNSMTMWARINKEGFLEAPYLRVSGGSIMSHKGLVPEWQFLLTKTESSGLTNIKPLSINKKVIQKTNSINPTLVEQVFTKQQLTGKVQGKTVVVSSKENLSTGNITPYFINYNPKALKIVASDLKISGSSFLPNIPLPTRDGAERSFSRNKRDDINFFGVSPTQNISVATSLIPFLEHDDATRALMGSNMQRQAVPLLKPMGPIVRTGLEGKVVGESGHALQANNSGVISKSTRTLIAIDTFKTKEKTISNLTFIPPFWANNHNLNENQINTVFVSKLNTIVRFFSKSFYSTKESFLINSFFKKEELLLYGNNNKGINFLSGFPKKTLLFTLGIGNKSLNKQINLLQPIVVNMQKFFYPFLFSSKNKKPNLLCTPILKNNGWRKNMQINRQRQIQHLQPYTRSNQATICVQRPAVEEGRWVQRGDLIGDCSASLNGVLALGQNIVVAYLPMEGFNFEDAIVVSERLVQEELYSSIHVQRVEFDTDASVKKQIPRKIKIKKHKSAYKTFQQDWITLHNPHLLKSEKKKLNSLGIIKVGSWVGPGDVLVSKVFPVERKIAPSRHLLLAVFQEKKSKTVDTDDTSLRVPKGIHGRVINVKIVGSGTIRSFKATNKHSRHKLFNKNNFINLRGSQKNFKQEQNLSNFNNAPVRTAMVAQTYKSYFRPCGQHKQDFNFFSEILTVSSKKLQKNLVDREFFTTVWTGHKSLLKTKQHKIWAEGWRNRLSLFKIFTYFKNNTTFFLPTVKLAEFVVTGFKVVRGISYYNNNSNQNNYYLKNSLNQNYCFDTSFVALTSRNFKTRREELLTIKSLEQGTLSAKLSPKLRYSLKYSLQTLKLKILKNKTDVIDALCTSVGPINSIDYSRVTTNNFVGSINYSSREYKQTQNSQYGVAIDRHNNINPLFKTELSTNLFSKTKPAGNYNIQGEYKILQVRIYIAERKKLQVGDKMSGRHGNKGIVSTILPREDMPYLPDGTSIDMVLNPLGIPSRMNVGQVFECLLGLAASICGEIIGHTPFDEMYGPEASRSLVYLFLYVARLRAKADWLFQPNFPGKTVLFDGRTGTPFEQWVTVGRAYMLKLLHMVDEKIHARSIGPRSLVTQQPIKGRARGGGQRLGEMELWALEGFGAAYTLQEMLTLKSDDIRGREEVENSIITARAAVCHLPETFKMMLFELKCLCLNVELNQNC